MDGERIGERLEWLQDIIERAKGQEQLLDDTELDFINQLDERVEKYDKACFVSVAQINWLNRIDAKLGK